MCREGRGRKACVPALGIEAEKILDTQGRVRNVSTTLFSANLFGEQAVFLLRKK